MQVSAVTTTVSTPLLTSTYTTATSQLFPTTTSTIALMTTRPVLSFTLISTPSKTTSAFIATSTATESSSTVAATTTTTPAVATTTITTPAVAPTVIPKMIPAVVPGVAVDDNTININGDNVTLTLSWGEPFNNLDPIVNYTVSCSGDDRCPPNFTTTDNTTRSYTISNLTPMTNYTFSVVATNSIGSGEAGIVMIPTPGIAKVMDVQHLCVQFYEVQYICCIAKKHYEIIMCTIYNIHVVTYVALIMKSSYKAIEQVVM